MKTASKITAILLAAAMAGTAFTACGTKRVEFTDSALEEIVRTALGKTEGDITPEDMETLTELDLSGQMITDISVLSYAKKLEKLDISDNNISDISVLAELEALTEVNLLDNGITDFTAVKEVKTVFAESKHKDSLPNSMAHTVIKDSAEIAKVQLFDDSEKLTAENTAYVTSILADCEALLGIDTDVIIVADLMGYESADEFAADYIARSADAVTADGRIVLCFGEEWSVTAEGDAKQLFDDEACESVTADMNKKQSNGGSEYDAIRIFLSKLQQTVIAQSGGESVIYTAEELFENKLREAAGKSEGLLFAKDFESITTLDLSGAFIVDITPLARLSGITELDLSNNEIADISALKALADLEKLDLSGNAGISDISALSELEKLTDLALEGTSVTDFTAVEQVANVDIRPEMSDPADTPIPVTPPTAQKYHSVIPSRTYQSSPIAPQLNDAADFLNGFEEALIKGYIDSVTKSKGYQISFVSISELEGYSAGDFDSGLFNSDYRKYNGFVKTPDWAHLTYNVRTSRWVLTADGALIAMLENDSDVASKFETDFANGIVRGNGYEDLVDILLKLVKSI